MFNLFTKGKELTNKQIADIHLEQMKCELLEVSKRREEIEGKERALRAGIERLEQGARDLLKDPLWVSRQQEATSLKVRPGPMAVRNS